MNVVFPGFNERRAFSLFGVSTNKALPSGCKEHAVLKVMCPLDDSCLRYRIPPFSMSFT